LIFFWNFFLWILDTFKKIHFSVSVLTTPINFWYHLLLHREFSENYIIFILADIFKRCHAHTLMTHPVLIKILLRFKNNNLIILYLEHHFCCSLLCPNVRDTFVNFEQILGKWFKILTWYRIGRLPTWQLLG
jgi:hypothetical protein